MTISPPPTEAHLPGVSEQIALAKQFLASNQTEEAQRILGRILLADPKNTEAKTFLIAHNLAPKWKLREWQEQDQYHYFVDDSIHEFQGAAAAEKIAAKNDARFVTADGILQVDAARWNEAQRFERKTWMEQNLGARDDRNEFHKKEFAGYQAIAGRKFDNVIELGCGPFTNLRLITPLIEITGRIDLLDPLVDSYLTHPNCKYAAGTLAGKTIQTVASPIETFVPTLKYDLLVMINVLEHCFDIPRIFTNIRGMLKPGGTFVFADVTTTSEAIRANNIYDAGHPIRMVDSFLTATLKQDYEPLYHNNFRDVTHLQYRDICHYYIGRRKG